MDKTYIVLDRKDNKEKEFKTSKLKEIFNSNLKILKNDTNNRLNITLNNIPPASEFMPNVGGGKTVHMLDYGCGEGFYSYLCSKKGYDIKAIDLSKKDIEMCNIVYDDLANVNFTNDNIQSFKDSSFDLVLSSQVIEHTHNPGNYLSQINRVLKMGASLFISLPNIMNLRFLFSSLNPSLEKNLLNMNKDILNNYDKTNHHIQAWDPIHFTILISSMGFEIKKYLPMEGMAFPLKKYFPSNYHTNIKSLKNLSYTMLFILKKVKDIRIDNYD